MQQPDDATDILSWDRVAGATRYEVAGGRRPRRSPALCQRLDRQHASSADEPRPAPLLAVRALTGSSSGWAGRSSASPRCRRSRRPATAHPRPADQPAAAAWAAVPGAIGYKVEVDGDATSSARDFDTTTTSLVVDRPLEPRLVLAGDRDQGHQLSPCRATARFTSALPSPIAYRRRRRTSSCRTSSSTGSRSRAPCRTTSRCRPSADFSQGGALIDDADRHPRHALLARGHLRQHQYFWRVRAIDMTGQATAWSRGALELQPHLAAPSRRRLPGRRRRPRSSGDPLYFQWTLGPRTPPSTSSRSARSRTSPSAPSTAAASPARPTCPGMFAINTTGSPATIRAQRGLRARRPARSTTGGCAPLDRPFTKGATSPACRASSPRPRPSSTMPLNITNMSPSGGADRRRADPDVGHRPSAPRPTRSTIVSANGAQVVKPATTSSTVLHPARHRRSSTRPTTRYTWCDLRRLSDRRRQVRHLRQRSSTSRATPRRARSRALTPLTPTSSTTGHHDAPAADLGARCPARTTTRSTSARRPTPTRSGSAHSADRPLRQAVPYPAMTDTSPACCFPARTTGRSTAYDADNRRDRTGPEGRFTVEADRARRPGTRVAHRRPAARRQLRRHREPVHARRPVAAPCRARRC